MDATCLKATQMTGQSIALEGCLSVINQQASSCRAFYYKNKAEQIGSMADFFENTKACLALIIDKLNPMVEQPVTTYQGNEGNGIRSLPAKCTISQLVAYAGHRPTAGLDHGGPKSSRLEIRK